MIDIARLSYSTFLVANKRQIQTYSHSLEKEKEKRCNTTIAWLIINTMMINTFKSRWKRNSPLYGRDTHVLYVCICISCYFLWQCFLFRTISKL